MAFSFIFFLLFYLILKNIKLSVLDSSIELHFTSKAKYQAFTSKYHLWYHQFGSDIGYHNET